MSKKVLYNVTVKVDKEYIESWLKWMKEHHIPDVMRAGGFERYTFTRILADDPDDGATFAIQYLSENMEKFMHYHEHLAQEYRDDYARNFPQGTYALRTLMEVEEEG